MDSTENHQRFVTSVADEDIISNLAEHLIDPILERLPIQEAVRTSVLSQKWRYRWTTMSVLNVDFDFAIKLSSKGAFDPNGFIRVINKIMTHHKGPIFRFVLYIPYEINLDSFQEVDQWILILSRNSVKQFILVNSNQVYPLHSSVFSCMELKYLGIYNCIFKPPIGFEGFPNLQSCNLMNIHFGDNLGGTVINLPQLKMLALDTCGNVKSFNIKALNLRTLRVISCLDAMSLPLLHSERLDVVQIRLLKSKVDFPRVERFNLAVMLSKLPMVVSFTIDGYFLKFLAAEKFPKWLPHEAKCLKKLEFQSFNFGDLDQLEGALYMLQNSPDLKGLHVTHEQMGPDADLELTSNHLESHDCLQTLFMLQTVELTSLEGSRPELLFIKLLLDHSPRLENMIIRPKATTDTEKRYNIAKDVMLFPRASSKAKMVFLDPQP
ncbi:F-box/FBD/LRR-repeat protein At1g13570 [Helianthus annuus]|nr:F-box/FBD/LRR-repeat protein At1g13570 [Helianthus annuus]